MGRTSKAKQLEEQETANQERLEHSEKVQQLAKLRSLPPTICDCPSHASYRMWCPTGDITIPKCAKRCPFCTFEARACNITAFLVRKHMKDTHLHTERFWGLRILTAPSMESMLFPMSSTDEGAPEENHNPFSPRSHSERQVSGETPIKREIPATADRKRPIDDLDATSAPTRCYAAPRELQALDPKSERVSRWRRRNGKSSNARRLMVEHDLVIEKCGKTVRIQST